MSHSKVRPTHLNRSAVIYVDDDAPPSGNGMSWATAHRCLQDALAVATHDDEIHVAEGIYKPDQGVGHKPGDRHAAFQVGNGLTIRGGFRHHRKDFAICDPNRYLTILSGDLAGNDSSDSKDRYQENSFHVVVAGGGIDADTVLDGITITGGRHIDDPASQACGGGLEMWDCRMTLRRCVFIDNRADFSGGAIYASGCAPLLEECLFAANRADRGGACFWRNSQPRFRRCQWVDNVAVTDGGAILMTGGILTVQDCDFVENRAGGYGGAIMSWGMTKMNGCRFEGNLSTEEAFFSFPEAEVSTCEFSGNTRNRTDSGNQQPPLDSAIVRPDNDYGYREPFEDEQTTHVPLPEVVSERIRIIVLEWFDTAYFEGPQKYADLFGPVFRISVPKMSFELYAFLVRDVITSSYEIRFVLYDPDSGMVSAGSEVISGRSQFEGLRPLVRFEDLEDDGVPELILVENFHWGTECNTVTFHYFRFGTELSFIRLYDKKIELSQLEAGEDPKIVPEDTGDQDADRGTP